MLDQFPRFDNFRYIDSDMLLIRSVKSFLQMVNDFQVEDKAIVKESIILCGEYNSPGDKIQVNRGELYHTGMFLVNRNVKTEQCLLGLATGMINGAKRDQALMTKLVNEGIWKVSTLSQRVISFPSSEQSKTLGFDHASMFLHFTGIRRDIATHEVYTRVWNMFSLPGLYKNTSLSCL